MNAFEQSLYEQTVRAIADDGCRHVLLLGANAAALKLEASLHALRLPDLDVVVDDPDAPDGSHDTGRPDVVVVCSDHGKEELLRAFVRVQGDTHPLPRVILAGTGHLEYRDATYEALDAPAMVPSYATGYANTRIHIYQCLVAAAANGLEGAVVEFGAFKGGTTAWLARVVDELGLNSSVVGFDAWEGFPDRRSTLDMYEHDRCVFHGVDEVRRYVEPYGVELVVGDICDTYETLRGQPLLLCFFDTDNYSPTRAALKLCADQLVGGGAIVFDHYTTTADYLYTLGERMAANEVLPERGFLNLHDTGVFLKL